MPIEASHNPDKRRYYGEQLAEEFLEFMRDDGPRQCRIAFWQMRRHSPQFIAKLNTEVAAGRERVAELVDCLQFLFGKPFRGDTAKESRIEGKKMNRCNRLLQRYKVSWLVGPAWNDGDIGSTSEEDLKRARFGFVELVVPERGLTPQECHAVRAVMRLAGLNAVLKLRTCKQCGGWFYARFEHQRFCAKNCQIKHNTSSEKWKEYKRNKAREYYHLHNSGKVRES